MNTAFKLSLSFTFLLCACNEGETIPDASWPESLKTQVGQVYEIRWTQSTETAGDTGSSGSSNSRNTLIEKVLRTGPNELVLEYDMPSGTSDIDRRRSWQFPARVRLTPDNKMTLLNADDLKVRNDDWLAWGNYNQSHCGKWLFTWTAQKIECDPNSVIGLLDTFNIRRANLKAGVPYVSFAGLDAVSLVQEPSGDDIMKLTAVLELDPEKLRKERAESNLIVAQIMGEKTPTLEEVLQRLQNEKIAGTIEITYTLDSMGEPIRRVQINQANIVNIDGLTETLKSTETVERRLIE